MTFSESGRAAAQGKNKHKNKTLLKQIQGHKAMQTFDLILI
jgi:hypothetical protein